MLSLSEIERKRKRLEQVATDASRCQGELDGLAKSLKGRFGVASLADAAKLLKKLRREQDKAQEQCVRLEEAFREKWGEKLGESNA